MGNRLSKIYTRTGDDGTTGLGDGTRTDKDSLRVEAFGTIDELNSAIGLVRSFCEQSDIDHCLEQVQHQLFNIGGELCMPGMTLLEANQVEQLEQQLDVFNDSLPPLQEFILPGGGASAAHTHMARTICRRAERRVLSLAREASLNEPILRYLNRLSDLLFVIARVLSRVDAEPEVQWEHERHPKTKQAEKES